MAHAGTCPEQGSARPRLEIASVFNAHGRAFRRSHTLSLDELRAMRAIEACRTAALGGHVDTCDTCGHEANSYNSCRNRHCPKCQSLSQARWIAKRQRRILPSHHFHVVFTLPAELRRLALRNRKRVFDLLFEAAAQTLLALGADPERLGATLGFTAVLHTWTRDLRFHPHLHVIVTGGGLSLDRRRWIAVRGGRFLFPVKVLSRLFRGKFLAALSEAHTHDELVLTGPAAALAAPGAFQKLKRLLYAKEWVVYAKRPFGGAQQVFAYLGRYTHRVGLSNQRLDEIGEAGVRFHTKDGKSVTLAPPDFIGRFLLHVLPAGFVKIRHYGLLAAGNVGTKLEVARSLLETPAGESAALAALPCSWQEWLLMLTGQDASRCPLCQTGHLRRRPLAALPGARSPPLENAS